MLNHHFTIKTDYRSLKYNLEQRFTTYFQQKWLVKLMEFNFVLSTSKVRTTLQLMLCQGCSYLSVVSYWCIRFNLICWPRLSKLGLWMMF